MEPLTNYKHKIDFLLLNQSLRPVKLKYKKRKCNECNKRRKASDGNHQICHICYKMKLLFKSSGNKTIDDFIRYTQINYVKKEGKLEFIPFDQFKNIEFIAEGGFSKIYKAIWRDGPISKWDNNINTRQSNYTVALKKLNNSKDITYKELNEVRITFILFKLINNLN
jgi:hypothetical protein